MFDHFDAYTSCKNHILHRNENIQKKFYLFISLKSEVLNENVSL